MTNTIQATPASAPAALPVWVEYALARAILTRHYQQTGEILDIEQLISTVAGGGSSPGQPEQIQQNKGAGPLHPQPASPLSTSSRSADLKVSADGYPPVGATGTTGQQPGVNGPSIPGASVYYQFPIPQMLSYAPVAGAGASAGVAPGPDRAERRRQLKKRATGHNYKTGWSWELAGQLLQRPEVRAVLYPRPDPALEDDDRRVLSFFLFMWWEVQPFRESNIIAIGQDRIQPELKIHWRRVRISFQKDNQAGLADQRQADSSIWRLIKAGVLWCYNQATLGLGESFSRADLKPTGPAWPTALDDIQGLHGQLINLPAEDGGQGVYFSRKTIQLDRGYFYRLPEFVRTAIEEIKPELVRPFTRLAAQFGHNEVQSTSELNRDMTPVRTYFGPSLEEDRTNLGQFGLASPNQVETGPESRPNLAPYHDHDNDSDNDNDRAHALEKPIKGNNRANTATQQGDLSQDYQLNEQESHIFRILSQLHLRFDYSKPLSVNTALDLARNKQVTEQEIEAAFQATQQRRRATNQPTVGNPIGYFVETLSHEVERRQEPQASAPVPAPIKPFDSGKFRNALPTRPGGRPGAAGSPPSAGNRFNVYHLPTTGPASAEEELPVYPVSRLAQLWQAITQEVTDRFGIAPEKLAGGQIVPGVAPAQFELQLPAGDSLTKMRISQVFKNEVTGYQAQLTW